MILHCVYYYTSLDSPWIVFFFDTAAAFYTGIGTLATLPTFNLIFINIQDVYLACADKTFKIAALLTLQDIFVTDCCAIDVGLHKRHK